MEKQLSRKAKNRIAKLIAFNNKELTAICKENNLSIYDVRWSRRNTSIDFLFWDNNHEYAAGEIDLK